MILDFCELICKRIIFAPGRSLFLLPDHDAWAGDFADDDLGADGLVAGFAYDEGDSFVGNERIEEFRGPAGP